MHTGPGHTRTTPRTRTTLALAACAILPLTGCSGGSSDTSKHQASASPSSTPGSGTPSATPTARTTDEAVPPLPKAAKGKVGEKRFARHVMDVWAYALRTNDPTPLVALGPGKQPCQGCARFASSLAERRRQGWSVDFPGLTVHTVTVRTIAGQSNAQARVDIPESDSYNSDGSYRNTSQAHAGATFQVRMHYTKKGYQLLSFTVA